MKTRMHNPISRIMLMGGLGFIACGGVMAVEAAPLPTTGAGSDLRTVALDKLDVTELDLQTLSLPDRIQSETRVDLRLGADTRTLVLKPYSVRSPDFTLYVMGANGTPEVAVPPPPVTIRGTVAGLPGSTVSGAVTAGRLTAIVDLGPEAGTQSKWCVQPLEGATPLAHAGEHAIYRASDIELQSMKCGVEESAPVQPPANSGESSQSVVTKAVDLAFDADFEFYVANGSSVDNTVNDIELVLNSVDIIYRRDTVGAYTARAILVHTSEPDPYFSTDAVVLLNEFRNFWTGALPLIPRDAAHLMTGKVLIDSVVGFAYQPGFCTPAGSFAYGLSMSRFSANLVSRVAVTAHELGHNWSAGHCDGNPDCDLMCSVVGGCNGNRTSFTVSAPTIIGYQNSPLCLGAFGNPSLLVVTDYRNIGPIEDGSAVFPYNTVREGSWRVEPGGLLFVRDGSYDERIIIRKQMVIQAENGLVRVGAP